MRAKEEEVWQASLPNRFQLALQSIPGLGLQGFARERVLFVSQNLTDPSQLNFQVQVAGWGSGNAMTGSFTVPAGYGLVAIFHTHPFVLYPEGAAGGKRGPSPADINNARSYPDAFHYIRSLGPVNNPFPGEWYYYGARAGFR